MYSTHSDAAHATNANSGPSTAARSTELHGFTWSHDSAAGRARTPASPDGGDSTDGDGMDQPLYSKLYERFIEKREVFVHSNIDVRRSVSVNQVGCCGVYFTLTRLTIVLLRRQLFSVIQPFLHYPAHHQPLATHRPIMALSKKRNRCTVPGSFQVTGQLRTAGLPTQPTIHHVLLLRTTAGAFPNHLSHRYARFHQLCLIPITSLCRLVSTRHIRNYPRM